MKPLLVLSTNRFLFTLVETFKMQKSPKEIFNSYAKQYQDKFMSFDLYHDSFDLFCKLIKSKNASVLEIGCGPGNITKYLLSKRPDFKLLGIDIAPNMIQLARINNPSASFKEMDCKNISEIKLKFDAIICGFTLPYLTKEEASKLIEDASVLLNPNGILYLSTMEDFYSKSKLKSPSSNESIALFTYYHEADYLSEFLQKNNFKILEILRKDYPEQNDDSKDLILIANKLAQP